MPNNSSNNNNPRKSWESRGRFRPSWVRHNSDTQASKQTKTYTGPITEQELMSKFGLTQLQAKEYITEQNKNLDPRNFMEETQRLNKIRKGLEHPTDYTHRKRQEDFNSRMEESRRKYKKYYDKQQAKKQTNQEGVKDESDSGKQSD